MKCFAIWRAYCRLTSRSRHTVEMLCASSFIYALLNSFASPPLTNDNTMLCAAVEVRNEQTQSLWRWKKGLQTCNNFIVSNLRHGMMRRGGDGERCSSLSKQKRQTKNSWKKNSSTTQRSISFVVRLLLVALPRTLIDTAEERWVCSSWGGDRRRRRTLLCFLRAYSLTRARTLSLARSRIFTSESQFSLWPISHARSLNHRMF